MTCIAIDDEPLALELLQDNIRQIPYLQLKAACSNAFEAMDALTHHGADLLITDIQMPGLNGLQFVASLEKKPLVILLTAYKQYALESYDLAVVDYLVKPVSLERFIKACNRAKELFDLQQDRSQHPKATPEFVFVQVDYSQVKLVLSDIVWIEGLRDYVKIHLRNPAKPLLVRATMKSMEDLLPAAQFIRIHKSYLVSVSAISSIKKNSLYLGTLELPIGDAHRETVDALLNK